MGFWGNVWEGTKAAGGAVADAAGTVYDAGKDVVEGAVNNVVDTGQAAAGGDWGTVYRNTVGRAVDEGTGAVSSLGDAASNFLKGNWQQGLGNVVDAGIHGAKFGAIAGAGTGFLNPATVLGSDLATNPVFGPGSILAGPAAAVGGAQGPVGYAARAGGAPVAIDAVRGAAGWVGGKLPGVGDFLSDVIDGSGGPAKGGGTPAPTGVGGTAANRLNQIADDLAAERNNLQPTVAPTVTAPQDLTRVNIAPGTQVTSQQIGPVDPITASRINAPTPIQAREISGPAPAVAGQMTAGQVAGARADDVSNIGMDSLGRDAQIRGMQMLEAAARGELPSAAEQLLRKGIDENVGAQLGMAATLQGRSAGAALRQGLVGSREAVAKSAADMAALRAKEQEQARRDVITAATSLRGQDVDVQKANQLKDTQLSINNLSAQIETQKANLAAYTAAGQANLAAQTQTNIANMQAELDAQKANQNALLTADIESARNTLRADEINAGNELLAKIKSGELSMQALTANQRSALEAAIANQNAETQRTLEQARLDQDLTKFSATQDLDAQKANQDSILRAAGMDMQYRADLSRALVEAARNAYMPEQVQAEIAARVQAGDQDFIASILKVFGPIVANAVLPGSGAAVAAATSLPGSGGGGGGGGRYYSDGTPTGSNDYAKPYGY